MIDIKRLLEESDERDILFIDEFMDKYKIIRSYGNAYILHQLLIDYREFLKYNIKNTKPNSKSNK